jgi:hypothetical protein
MPATWSERQITSAAHGHILTNVAVWSPDSRWIAYDVRSDPAGAEFDGTRIERVDVETGAVELLYESQDGACVGVVTCSPADDRVAFIHGPERPTPDWQYAPYHRRGAIVDARRPGVARTLDACNLSPPFTPGALRGGSHVHVFSGDGQWISFTYEDHVLAAAEAAQPGAASRDRNQRNVGVAVPRGPVVVPRTHERNHDGDFFSVLVTRTVNEPRPGSDEIARAEGDAWVGRAGYRRSDGAMQRRAIAFLGDVVAADGRPLTELFIVDLPDDVATPGDGPLEGTADRRPAPPRGTVQRRLTFTEGDVHPGVQGARHWARSSADGEHIAILRRDNRGVIQLWTVSPRGGSLVQATRHEVDVASAFTWHPERRQIAHVAGGAVWIADLDAGRSTSITPPSAALAPPRPEACVFSPDGRRIAYVRPVRADGREFNQIFVATSP